MSDLSFPMRNTFIACRTTTDFKNHIEAYAREKDLSISQIVRRGIKLVMEADPIAASGSIGR